ncbi:hypothetical protein ACFSKL_11765 [Belliella marina]|uniref:Uncharacterized protein n=1 Tax=Belliella marina TaxID=1644146 RepID=A0ABW4VQB0_9BACT
MEGVCLVFEMREARDERLEARCEKQRRKSVQSTIRHGGQVVQSTTPVRRGVADKLYKVLKSVLQHCGRTINPSSRHLLRLPELGGKLDVTALKIDNLFNQII